ncbi:hypothetical protein TNCV_2675281 [Trichonephila clavipes]|nr:hypothetical protein TNCV_2675281 [Trichonephila clavipes]
MYNLFTEHSKKQSYIQSTFMLSVSSRDPQNRSSACPFQASLSGTKGNEILGNPSPPLPQAATRLVSGPGTTFASTPTSSRENFFY